MIIKSFVIIVVVWSARQALGAPAAEGAAGSARGLGSALWGWLAAPLAWLGAAPDQPASGPGLGPASVRDTSETIRIFTRNVTVWCNNQTCTTQKCDELGCRNVTCNIYETDLMGECRVYDLSSSEERPEREEPAAAPGTGAPSPDTSAASPDTSAPSPSAAPHAPSPTAKGEPLLELEGFLSATVGSLDKGPGAKDDSSVEYQEV